MLNSCSARKQQRLKIEQITRTLAECGFVTLDKQAYVLGSGLIDQSQKMTVAAMQMADMKVWAHRS